MRFLLYWWNLATWGNSRSFKRLNPKILLAEQWVKFVFRSYFLDSFCNDSVLSVTTATAVQTATVMMKMMMVTSFWRMTVWHHWTTAAALTSTSTETLLTTARLALLWLGVFHTALHCLVVLEQLWATTLQWCQLTVVFLPTQLSPVKRTWERMVIY